eukprot:3818585-Ditylum_brightwellii.AAC.2
MSHIVAHIVANIVATDLGEAESPRKRPLCEGDSKWTCQRAERRVKPKKGAFPVLCPIDGCTKVYHWEEELVNKLPKDTTTDLSDFFEYWGDHY